MKNPAFVFCLCLSFFTQTSVLHASISRDFVNGNNQTLRFYREGGQPCFDYVSDAIMKSCNCTATNNPPIEGLKEQTFWTLDKTSLYYYSYLSGYAAPNATENLLNDPFYSCSARTAQTAVTAKGTGCGTELNWVPFAIFGGVIGGGFVVAGVIAGFVFTGIGCYNCLKRFEATPEVPVNPALATTTFPTETPDSTPSPSQVSLSDSTMTRVEISTGNH